VGNLKDLLHVAPRSVDTLKNSAVTFTALDRVVERQIGVAGRGIATTRAS